MAANFQIPLAKIVCRFRLSYTISENGTDFVSRQAMSFCSKYITQVSPVPTIHKAMIRPRSATTLSSTVCAKALIKQKASGWRNSLGCYGRIRLTKRIPTSKTPFSLAYGTEVIIPIDICMPMLRTRGNRSRPDCHQTLPCSRSIG